MNGQFSESTTFFPWANAAGAGLDPIKEPTDLRSASGTIHPAECGLLESVVGLICVHPFEERDPVLVL